MKSSYNENSQSCESQSHGVLDTPVGIPSDVKLPGNDCLAPSDQDEANMSSCISSISLHSSSDDDSNYSCWEDRSYYTTEDPFLDSSEWTEDIQEAVAKFLLEGRDEAMDMVCSALFDLESDSNSSYDPSWTIEEKKPASDWFSSGMLLRLNPAHKEMQDEMLCRVQQRQEKRDKFNEVLKELSDTSVDTFAPQMSLSMLSSISDFDWKARVGTQFFSQLADKDKIAEHIDRLVMLGVTISTQTSMAGLSAVVANYIREVSGVTVSDKIYGFVRDYILTTPQLGPDDWIHCIQSARDNWRMAKGSSIFTQFARLMSLLVTLGLCNMSALPFEIEKYLGHEKPMIKRIEAAPEMIDAFIETTTYFVESFYYSYKSKSLVPMFLDDKSIYDIDVEYSKLEAFWTVFTAGNLEEHCNLSCAEYEYRLTSMSSRLKAAMAAADKFHKQFISRKLTWITARLAEFNLYSGGTSFRPAPFAFFTYGISAQGKTMFNTRVRKYLLKSAGLPMDTKYVWNKRPGEQYDSGAKGYTLVVSEDDVGQEKPEIAKSSPVDPIIRFCNNEECPAIMADVEQKGKIKLKPVIYQNTTNKKDLHAGKFSVNPYAVLRRGLTITIRVKEEFQLKFDDKNCGIDGNKVNAKYGEDNSALDQDIWYITIERPIQPEKATHLPAYHVISDSQGKKMKDVCMKDALNCLAELFRSHLKMQSSLAKKANDGYVPDQCPHEGCCQLKGMCNEHDADPVSDVPTSENPRLVTQDEILEFAQKEWGESFLESIREEVREYHVQMEDDEDYDAPPSFAECSAGGYGADPSKFMDWGYHRLATNIQQVTTRAMDLAVLHASSKIRSTVVWSLIQLIPTGYITTTCVQDMLRELVGEFDGKKYKKRAKEGRRRLFYLTTLILILICLFIPPTMVLYHIFVFAMLHLEALCVVRGWESYSYTSKLRQWQQRIHVFKYLIYFVMHTIAGLETGQAIFLIMLQMAHTWKVVNDSMEARISRAIEEKNLKISDVLRSHRDTKVDIFLRGSLVLSSLYMAVKALRVMRERTSDFQPQSALAPKSAEEMAVRDAKVSEWATVEYEAPPLSERSKTSTAKDVKVAVQKNLVHLRVIDREKTGPTTSHCNALYLLTNIIVVPQHAFSIHGDQILVEETTHAGPNQTRRFHIAKSHSIFLPNTDIAICHVQSGSKKNIIDWFPTSPMPSVPVSVLHRTDTGSVTHMRATTNPGVVRTTKEFLGGTYCGLTHATFSGLCGAIVVSETQGAVLLGPHLGGREGMKEGCYGSLTSGQLNEAIQALAKKDLYPSGSDGDFLREIMGRPTLTGEIKPARKHPLNFLQGDNPQVKYHGECGHAVTPSTKAEDLPISTHVTRIMGAPNIYSGPDVSVSWKPWQVGLQNCIVQGSEYPTDLLDAAKADYLEPILENLDSGVYKGDIQRPLDNREMINGIPGKRFIDAIKKQTSAGLPYGGKKEDFLIDVSAEGDATRTLELHPQMQEEFDRVHSLYKEGKRAYPISKACVKDEIILAEKKKARLFYGNSFIQVLMVRKYFLPILRYLEMNPLLAEMAVGINVQSREWDEFYKHATKGGLDRIIGGDYSKYDQKLSAQLLRTSLDILITIASKMDGYTEDDLAIMRIMAVDLTHAYVAFNGSLISFLAGVHISGNSLTVVLNGISGSLNARCYWLHGKVESRVGKKMGLLEVSWSQVWTKIRDKEKWKFRDEVHLVTYGDDNIGSVEEKCKHFTIKGFSEFLARVGQVYTMPDKSADLTDFLPPNEFEFLKCSSVYHPRLGVHIGCLAEQSIFKQLHMRIKKKGSLDTAEFASAQNISSAMRYFRTHGEEHSERRRLELISVATAVDVLPWCTKELEKSYDQWADEWLEKHGDGDLLDHLEMVTESYED